MSEQCAGLEGLQSAWLDGALGTADHAKMAAHLEGCARCRAEVETLARTRTLLRSLPVRQVPTGLFAGEFPRTDGGRGSGRRRVGIGRIGGGRGGGPRRRGIGRAVSWTPRGVRARRRIASRIAAACAVTAGLIGGVAFGLGGVPEPPPRLVRIPVDVYAVDHLVRTVGMPLSTPVLAGSLSR